jgi:hypothetical protein
MKEQMQELYVEDLASHNGPDHAGISVRIFLKRCLRVRAGEVLSLESYNRDADPVPVRGKPCGNERLCEFISGPAGSARPSSRSQTFMHENRESHETMGTGHYVE